MEFPSLPLIRVATAAELASLAKLSDQAHQMLQPKTTPKEFLAALIAQKHFKDAYSFLVVALPMREAAWWGALCIRQSYGASRSKNDEAALAAAVEWILEPTATTRKAALSAGTAAGKASACGCLALAVGQTPPALAVAVPSSEAKKPGLANPDRRFLRRAILLASVHGDARVLEPYPEHFVKLGLGVASGEYTWKKLVVSGRERSRDG